jgi:hypothetical protein
MDLYTSIAACIALVVVAIIIWLIGPRTTRGHRDLEMVRTKSRQPTAGRSVVSGATNPRRTKTLVPYRPTPARDGVALLYS